MANPIQITPLDGLPLFNPHDDLAALIVRRAKKIGIGITDHDILVIGQKAVSKTEGRIRNIDDVRPTKKAAQLSKRTGKRAEFVQLVLEDSRKVLRSDKEALIVTTKHGFTCLNGGVDKSNVKGANFYAQLPKNPDASARRVRNRIRKLTGRSVAVIVSDTRSRPFRRGMVEETIGIAGLSPLVDYRGKKDLFGYQLRFKNVAVADELASAAELVMGQGQEATPVAIIRGLKRIRFNNRSSSKGLTIGREEDLFAGTL